MTQLKINVIQLLITFMINNFCYSQTVLGYIYSNPSDNENVFTFEERRGDSLLIYSLMAITLNRTDTLMFNNYFYLNNIHSGTITKDIDYFIDKYDVIDKLWLFYKPFQIDSTKNIIVKIVSKQIFLIKKGSLYVQNKNKSITLFTDFKKLKTNNRIQEIKADAKYDINSNDYVVENTFGDILLDSFYNCFRINKNYHITAYKIGGEWYREISCK